MSKRFLTYLWRANRHHFYSINDYSRLLESNPGDVTFREAARLQALSEAANG